MSAGGESNASRLAAYEQQLLGVEKLIALEPNNAQYIKLKEDLEEVIALTKDLVRVQEKTTSAAADADAAAAGAIGISQGGKKSKEQQKKKQQQQQQQQADDFVSFDVGATAEAKHTENEVWYPVRILGCDPSEGTYHIQFLTFQSKATISVLQLRKLQGVLVDHVPAEPTLAVGAEVAARYSADRVMYAAQIEAVTPLGYVVVYTAYGNKEEVPAEWITTDLSVVGTAGNTQEAAAAAAAANEAAPQLLKNTVSNTKKRKKAADAAWRAEMKSKIKAIPDSLRIMPDDSEAQKKKKKRIAKRLKANNRAVTMEIKQKDKANSWQKFAQKTKKKRAKGSLLNLRRKSIFASPTSIDGKVGVTGSGSGMTDFRHRKKFTLRGAP